MTHASSYPASWNTITPPLPTTDEFAEMLYYERADFDDTNPYFQYYSGNIRDSIPRGYVSLSEFIAKTRNPKPGVKTLLFDIRTEDDKARRDQLKTKLPAFTPAAVVHQGQSRKYDNIQHFTGLALLDFDGLPDRKYSESFRAALFNEHKFIFASWLSSSGKGVRAIVKIPRVTSTQQFKLHYAALEQDFEGYHGFDPAPKNAILPLYFSHDPGILYREEPTTYTNTYSPPQAPKPDPIPRPESSGKYHKWALSNIERAISRINSNGHPQLRAAAYAAGGYVGSGYITEAEALTLIDRLIETGYLKGKATSYKRTAREMVRKGQSEPLYIR